MQKLKITKEEINELPHIEFPGKIHVITNKNEYKKAIALLKDQKILGFDTETRPVFKKGQSYDTAMIQLATKDDAFIFRINLYSADEQLINILKNKDIIKAGAAIAGDLKDLRKLYNFEPGGFVEIQDIAKNSGINQLGLRSLTAILLDKRLRKKHRLTNWELPHLTAPQLNYAATDAWVGLLIYEKLQTQESA